MEAFNYRKTIFPDKMFINENIYKYAQLYNLFL